MSKREETNQKVSLKMKGKYTLSGKAREINISHMKKTWRQKSADLKLDDAKSKETRKRIVFNEQGRKCLHCNQGEIWHNKVLIFSLHHKDGDKHNNNRVNLEVLCPNCHTQTETFCKNK
jgi:Zn finger protein HypA/HybF involved in hydrogenase expression